MPVRHSSLLDSLGETPGQRNALLLIQLRWLAVFGQAFTIVFCRLQFDLPLPLPAMFSVVGGLLLLNLFSLLWPRRQAEVSHGELFANLLLDFAALTALLYLSGGANNPFAFLYVLQVMLGAILLEAWSTWVLTGLSGLAFALLTRYHWPLELPLITPDRAMDLHVAGTFVCYLLVVVLLVLLVQRITANLRQRDARLADLRQQAAEEDRKSVV
jgi:two-component system sensor histidine kinase RegB